ncbi:unnamed protein product [Trichogramma brassicae]|uniref:Reverse transcriptase domain-containing protein n=1 Tax=Trichogramma brassicae TaxID=86971 RepID=A0A6H5IUG4_9HYME|nr:unnamed protein product [Trichogramma brassicae]
MRYTDRITPTIFTHTLASTLQTSLQRVDPLHVQDRASLDLLVDTTTTAIYNTLDVLAPLRNVTIKSKARPWVTPELRLAIRSRDRAYRRARRNPTTSHIASYRKSRSTLRNILDSAKNKFLSSKINAARDSSACWRTLRGLGLSRDTKPSPLLLFSPEDLNNHYASVSRGAIPLSEEMVNCAASLPVADTIPIFALHQVTEIEVLSSINSLCSKGAGIDNIPAGILKLASTSVITELTAVVNKSIELSYFPSSWKRAVITPLSKTNAPSSPSDTRPIAQLPEMAKILERIVHHQLLFHLTSHGLLDAHQFGFRPGHSTQTAVLDLTESIRRAIDKRKVSMVVSFDFSKAFDTIPHCLLIEKLRLIRCSARTLGWFASYLTGRSQAIRLSDGSCSSFATTTAGVPQGSVLEPLLFLVFINDLSTRLSSSQHMIYADDTQIFCSGLPASPQALLDNANNDVSAIAAWADDNGIKLNSGKTGAMLLCCMGKKCQTTFCRPGAPGRRSGPCKNFFENFRYLIFTKPLTCSRSLLITIALMRLIDSAKRMGCKLGKLTFSRTIRDSHLNQESPPLPPATDPRLPLTARQKYILSASWKAIAKAIEPTGIYMFIRYGNCPSNFV